MTSAEPDLRFVHAADLHLGGRRWLRTRPTDRAIAERVRLADRLALGALVDLCLTERADLLLCAGDIIDGWCRDHGVGLWLVRELLRLRDARCEVALVFGNHDVRTRVLRPLLLPDHTRTLGLSGPETRVVDRLGVAIHGWSFPEPAEQGDVADRYPEPLADLFNVGLLHTSAEGRRGHARYAPCSRRALRRHGYDYWALGHVHAREVVAQSPWIVFPGNLQGRGAREPGPKGATVVRAAGGRVASVEHRSLDAVRFETVEADASEAERFDDVLRAAGRAIERVVIHAEGRPVIVRLVLIGEAGAALTLEVPPTRRRAAFRAVAAGLGAGAACIDEIRLDVGSWSMDLAA
jgi:DNA repair exonuclease SbcCD nuclease subunit